MSPQQFKALLCAIDECSARGPKAVASDEQADNMNAVNADLGLDSTWKVGDTYFELRIG